MNIGNMRAKVIALVGFAFVCVALFLYLFTQAGGRIRLHSPYQASAIVPDALNIVNNADVRRDGVKIGRVRSIEPQGQDSKITFEIEKKSQATIYRNATVRVRTKTLVGESYLDLDPGTPSTGKLANKAVLPLSAATEIVPLERILSTLDAHTRQQVRRNLSGIGVGLDGQGQNLNKLFGAINPVVVSGGRLGRILAPQRRQLAALIDNTGQVLGALGERTAAFQSLAIDAKTTAEAVNQRDAQFRQTLAEIPATLDRAQTSVRKLRGFAGTATPVFRSLKLSSRQLSPAIVDLGPTAKSTRTLFAELNPFLTVADPLLGQLSPASKSLRTVFRPLDAFLRQTSPTAGYLKQYHTEFGSFFANVGALVSAKDKLGYRGRVFAMTGPDAVTNLTPDAAKIVHALTENVSLGLLKTRLNPYPKPGTVGNEQNYDGSYTQVKPGG